MDDSIRLVYLIFEKDIQVMAMCVHTPRVRRALGRVLALSDENL
jgi:hypothetical protein